MEKSIFISIGSNCDVSSTLRNYGVRQMAFPFDWNLTSLYMVYNILHNNFKDYLSDVYIGESTERLYIDDNRKTSGELIIPIICKKYNVLFPHDMKINESINEVQNKYLRRIERFKEIINDKSKIIYLVYHNPRFCLNEWQRSVYKQYDENILDKINDFSPAEYISKIKEIFKDKSNVHIIQLQKMRSIIKTCH